VVAAFLLSCAYGRAPVIDYFVAHGGVDVDTELKGHGDGHTGLHVAAFHGQLEAVRVLLKNGANVHAIDKTWKTPPLVWALTGWQQSGHNGQYYAVVAELVAVGATVTPDLIAWDKAQLDPQMGAALRTGSRPT
jgi:ankyrin repeat protein